LLFDSRTNVECFTWTPSELAKTWIGLWIRYACEQQLPDYFHPLLRVLPSQWNMLDHIAKRCRVLFARVTVPLSVGHVISYPDKMKKQPVHPSLSRERLSTSRGAKFERIARPQIELIT